MKKGRNGLFFGIILVCTAVVLILDGLGISIGGADLSFWRIAGGILCLAWLIAEIVDLKFSRIFFPLSFIFLLFEGQIAVWCGAPDTDLISNWIVILAALLLTIGVGTLGGNLKKHKTGDGITKKNFTRASTVYIDASDLGSYNIENDCGLTHVYIENADRYKGEGVINVENNCGSVVVHIPKEWKVFSNIENSLGSVKIPQHETEPGAMGVRLAGENNLGSLEIIFE